MKIVHRIAVGDEPERRAALRSLGVKFDTSDGPFVRLLWFDIDEQDDLWPKVKLLIDEWDPFDAAGAKFTEAERAAASFLQVHADEKGYPLPKNDFGYLRATYDLSDFCNTCGIGGKQVAPFRIKGEPKWGKRHIFGLNWVYDELFVTPPVWKEVFQPFGIESLPVLNHRTGAELQTVVQLQIRELAHSHLKLDERHRFETCGVCGRKKYLPVVRGFFPAFADDPCFPICKTQEYFGSGGSAWHATIISKEVYKAIQEHKLKTLAFVPLEDR